MYYSFYLCTIQTSQQFQRSCKSQIAHLLKVHTLEHRGAITYTETVICKMISWCTIILTLNSLSLVLLISTRDLQRKYHVLTQSCLWTKLKKKSNSIPPLRKTIRILTVFTLYKAYNVYQ